MSARRPGSGWSARGPVVTASRWMLRTTSRLVPGARREDWLREREGELWALWKRGHGAATLLRFALDGVGDALRERTGEGMMTGLGGDLRQGLRSFRRFPATSLATVLVMAVGIGANTAIFSVLHAALLRPVPFPDPERLVAVDLTVRPEGSADRRPIPFSWPAYRLVRERTSHALHLAGFTARDVTLLGAGDAARISVELVTPSYFDVLGIEPALGRTVTASEGPPASAPVVVLSDALWTSRFGRDPDVLGRTVRLDRATVTVVGVLAPGFEGLTGGARAWVSMALAPELMDPRRLERPASFWFYAVGRLEPGRSPADGAGVVATAGRALRETIPDAGGELGARVRPFLEARVNPDARLSILVVLAAAALFLLIACANAAGLQVAREVGRRSERAVRVALGAGRIRLLRAALVESLVPAVIGGSVGVAGAWLGVGALADLLPFAVGTSGSNRLQFLDAGAIDVNGPVLLFAVAVTVGAGLITAALPALGRGRRAVASDLRAGGREGGDGGRVGLALVAGQLGLAVVLLAGTGLMLGSLTRMLDVDLGLGDRSLTLARYELPRGTLPEEAAAFHQALEARLPELPGVGHGALAQCTPLSGRCDIVSAAAVGGAASGAGEGSAVTLVFVGQDYFDAVGIPVLAGRTFGPDDRAGSPLVAVVSQGAARRLFPGGEALEGSFTASFGPLAEAPGARVVGVVGDVRYDRSLAEDIRPTVYVSYRQLPVGYMTVLLATDASSSAVVPALRSAMAEVRPDVPLFEVTSLEAQIRSVTARTRVVLALLAVFAGAALVLAALGVYGLTSFVVARRTREIGVRMALGASGRRVLTRVLGGVLLVGAAGLLGGALGALGLTRLMKGLLFEMEPNDPRVLGGVGILLLVVTVVAGLVPAVRATLVDPSTALRDE